MIVIKTIALETGFGQSTMTIQEFCGLVRGDTVWINGIAESKNLSCLLTILQTLKRIVLTRFILYRKIRQELSGSQPTKGFIVLIAFLINLIIISLTLKIMVLRLCTLKTPTQYGLELTGKA